MVRKSLCQLVRYGGCEVKLVPRRFSSQRRDFSSSGIFQKHGGIPTFTETSSRQLDDLLSTMRHNLFLPWYLPKAQREFTRKLKNRKALEAEPVIVDIGGEKFQLRSLWDRKIPGRVKGLREAVELMKDKKDWDNLPALLEGLTVSRAQYNSSILEKLVRRAGQVGRQDVIFECVKRVSKTGFAMKDLSVVQSIMWWIQYGALSNDWSARETKRALSMAEQIAILLEEKNHTGGPLTGWLDPRARPEVIGILLQLAAANAKVSGENDENGKVRLYAKRLLGSLQNAVGFHEALPSTISPRRRSNALVLRLSPVVYGMRLAMEILDTEPEIARMLKQQEALLSNEISNEYKILLKEIPPEAPSLVLQYYSKLFGVEGPR